MFPDVLQELRSYFGRDFLLGVFFPVLIFVGASLTLFFEVTQGLASTLAAWERLSLQSQLLTVLGSLIVCLVLSYLIYNFQYSITRLFEGYWPRYLRRLRVWRTGLYKNRWDYLEDRKRSAWTEAMDKSTGTSRKGIALQIARESVTEQSIYYPPRKHIDNVMPTRIGNILLDSELYARDHYGIDSVTIWTRLRPLLAGDVIAPLEGSRTARDFMLLMSALSATFTLIWCPVLAIFTSRWDLFLLCAAGWPLAWVCYYSAVQSTLAYSERLKAVFDLHRNDLLKALNRKIPENAEKERKEWTDLSDFFSGNHEIDPSPPEADKEVSLDKIVTALAEYLKKVNPPTT